MMEVEFPKDITEGAVLFSSNSPETKSGSDSAKVPGPSATGTGDLIAPKEQDHPGMALLDIAIEESIRYCEKEGFPAPNMSLWHNFSRGFLNKSLWHYFPTGASPESPAICALIGVAGLAVCYTPVILAFYDKKQKEGKDSERKKIDEHPRKTAEIREEPVPEQSNEIDRVYIDEPEPVAPIAAPRPSFGMTNSPPIPAVARRIEAAEPAAPGMG